MEKFNYIIACLWPETNQLNTYTLYHQVQYGSQEDTEKYLAYVKKQSPKEDWKIIKISLQ